MFIPPLQRLVLPVALGMSLAISGVRAPNAVQAQSYGQAMSVSIAQYMFQPGVLRITVGTTVTWTNYDGVMHTTTSDTGAWNSGPLNPGASFRQTFTSPGTYWYHCMFHVFMHGVIIVQAASGQVSATINPVRNGGTTGIVGQGFTPNTWVFVQWRRPEATMTGFWARTRLDGSVAFGLFANPRHGCGPRTFEVYDSVTRTWSPPFVLSEFC